MKKILLAVLAAGLMSTSASAATWYEGKVRFIQTDGENVRVKLRLADESLLVYTIQAATADVQKTIIAMILTAQAADRNIKLYEQSGVWTSVLLAE